MEAKKVSLVAKCSRLLSATPQAFARSAYLFKQLTRLGQNGLDALLVRKHLLRLDLPVKEALDEAGAKRLREVARDVAVLLRVDLDLLQEQLPHLEQAVGTIEPLLAQLAVSLPESLNKHLELVAEAVVERCERLREVGHFKGVARGRRRRHYCRGLDLGFNEFSEARAAGAQGGRMRLVSRLGGLLGGAVLTLNLFRAPARLSLPLALSARAIGQAERAWISNQTMPSKRISSQWGAGRLRLQLKPQP